MGIVLNSEANFGQLLVSSDKQFVAVVLYVLQAKGDDSGSGGVAIQAPNRYSTATVIYKLPTGFDLTKGKPDPKWKVYGDYISLITDSPDVNGVVDAGGIVRFTFANGQQTGVDMSMKNGPWMSLADRCTGVASIADLARKAIVTECQYAADSDLDDFHDVACMANKIAKVLWANAGAHLCTNATT